MQDFTYNVNHTNIQGNIMSERTPYLMLQKGTLVEIILSLKKRLKDIEKLSSVSDATDFIVTTTMLKKQGLVKKRLMAKGFDVGQMHLEFSDMWTCPNHENDAGMCVYDHSTDPCHDICLFCGDPEERK